MRTICNIYNRCKKAVAMVCLTMAMPVFAQTSHQNQATSVGMNLTDVSMKRNAGLMTVDLNLGLGSFGLVGNRVAVFTPMIVNETDTLFLQPVSLYSRTRWYQYLRSGEKPLGGEGETAIRWSERPATMAYTQTVPYAEWMDGSQLYLRRSDYGCCRKLLRERTALLTGYRELKYIPTYRYVRPAADAAKTRELSGRAFIDFVVNRTEINPTYRNNRVELGKITATIDSVRSDKDITVKRITIKGFASPEGSYENNTRLAKGRTEALKQYVRKLYNFSNDFISTAYEPEDWEGLRAFVESSNLSYRSEILAIIDDRTLDPDTKDWRIKLRYPEDYAFLLREVYPGLRHSDYTIEYSIRTYTAIDEIRQIIATAPQKLSLNEMFLLAETYEPGSTEYNEVFETAVRMYPNDEVANLNAANSAMIRNDLPTAVRYLEKAGQSDNAQYARGVLAGLQGDNATAIQLFSPLESSMPEAAKAIKTIKEIMEYSGK